MKKEIYFDTVEERNKFITECYNKNIKYNYFGERDGKYKVIYWEN